VWEQEEAPADAPAPPKASTRGDLGVVVAGDIKCEPDAAALLVEQMRRAGLVHNRSVGPNPTPTSPTAPEDFSDSGEVGGSCACICLCVACVRPCVCVVCVRVPRG
jgi:hypothetical protein